MPWNWMQLMHHAEDFRVEPAVGPGEMTFEEARTAIQGMLDGLVQKIPDLAPVADHWRQVVSDNAAAYQALMWAVYQHEPGQVRAGAQAWLEEAAARDRANGIDAQVARFRNSE